MPKENRKRPFSSILLQIKFPSKNNLLKKKLQELNPGPLSHHINLDFFTPGLALTPIDGAARYPVFSYYGNSRTHNFLLVSGFTVCPTNFNTERWREKTTELSTLNNSPKIQEE